MFEDWRSHRGAPGTPGRHEAGRRGARRGIAILLALVLLGLGVVAAGAVYWRWCEGASGPKNPVTVVVPTGDSGGAIIGMLHSKGVIRCGLVSRIIARRNHKADAIRAGTYHLTTNMTLSDALDALNVRPHKAVTVRLLIPEGFRLTQIAARVHAEFAIPANGFLGRATSATYALPPYLPNGTKTLEGFLFPATYDVPKKTASADGIIRTLLQEFVTQVKPLPWKNAQKFGVTPYQVVVIASMIEREARVATDRPKIAEVIYRRLRMNIPLGIDATLVYVYGNHLTESELKSKNPYNTRTRTGLPPTPIASPGLASIKAALEPSTVPYLYYVACPTDGPGHQRFSETYSKFLHDKAECLG